MNWAKALHSHFKGERWWRGRSRRTIGIRAERRSALLAPLSATARCQGRKLWQPPCVQCVCVCAGRAALIGLKMRKYRPLCCEHSYLLLGTNSAKTGCASYTSWVCRHADNAELILCCAFILFIGPFLFMLVINLNIKLVSNLCF